MTRLWRLVTVTATSLCLIALAACEPIDGGMTLPSCVVHADNPHKSETTPGFMTAKGWFKCERTTPREVRLSVNLQQRAKNGQWVDVAESGELSMAVPRQGQRSKDVVVSLPCAMGLGTFQTWAMIRGVSASGELVESEPTTSREVKNPCH